MVERERVQPGRVHICVNGINLDRFHAAPNRYRWRRDSDEVVVGVVCMLRPEKNLQLLMRAFSTLQPLNKKLKLVVVGGGPELPELLKLRAELRLDESQCLFEAATKNVPYWLNAIDIFVLPSRYEDSANSLIEAMACGCCVVGSATGGNIDLIEHLRTGLLFQTDNLSSLMQQLQTAIRDEGLRKDLGDNAARFVRARFSWENSARTMEDIYARLLESSRPAMSTAPDKTGLTYVQ